MDFLEKIVISTRQYVAANRARMSLIELREKVAEVLAISATFSEVSTQAVRAAGAAAAAGVSGAEGNFYAVAAAPTGITGERDFPFEQVLSAPGLSCVCELKKASPSKGIIAKDFPYMDIAQEYRSAGADALSVLTEPLYFLGSAEYLSDIVAQIPLPVLRKDFIIDEYQVFESRLLGAAAILLIVTLLDDEQLNEFITCAHSIGLSVLVEVHSEEDLVRALSTGARIVGINSRDLRNFEVDKGVFARLRPSIPREVLCVAESGIRTRDDVKALESLEVDAMLIGERLMRAPDKKACLAQLRGEPS